MSSSRYRFRKEDLENTPSRKDGFPPELEARWRRRYCWLIERATIEGQNQGSPFGFTALQTAILYLHQYYAIRSMASNDPLIMVTAALYLACKVEEQPKSLTRVSQIVYGTSYAGFTEAQKHVMKQEIFLLLKQRVLKAERSLLYALGFNIEVQHPSTIAVEFLQTRYNVFLPEEKRVSPEQWAQECTAQSGEAFELLNQLCSLMWHLGFLSFQIPYYLHYDPVHIATACIYMAVQMMQLDVKPENGWQWWHLDPLQCPFPVLDGILTAELTASLKDLLERARQGNVPDTEAEEAIQAGLTKQARDPKQRVLQRNP